MPQRSVSWYSGTVVPSVAFVVVVAASSGFGMPLTVHITCPEMEVYMKAPEVEFDVHLDMDDHSNYMGFGALEVYGTDMDIALGRLVAILDIVEVVHTLSPLHWYSCLSTNLVGTEIVCRWV